MIPTPAKRLSQLQPAIHHHEPPDEDEEEIHYFEPIIGDHHDEAVELREEEEEEEEDYLRLDTIVEEEEEAETEVAPNGVSGKSGDMRNSSGCDLKSLLMLRNHHNQRVDAENDIIFESLGSPAEISKSADISNNHDDERRPPQATDWSLTGVGETRSQYSENVNNSLRKFTSKVNTQQQQLISKTKMQQQQQQQHHDANKTPLPSTNRLISEHQVRQQQALFRALAERQKLMDELDPSERVDLMSAAAVNLSRVSRLAIERRRKQQRRRRFRRSHDQQTAASPSPSQSAAATATPTPTGMGRISSREEDDDEQDDAAVPLSAVDLSSMSDRMLEELLGRIASASSSSSLSSNAESLDSSSDLSAADGQQDEIDSSDASVSSSFSDTQTDPPTITGSFSSQSARTATGGYQHHGRHTRMASSAKATALRRNETIDAPNVIGVHEDERTRATGKRINCRDAHRRFRTNGNDYDSDSEDDDDNDQADHELIVHLNNNGSPGDDLSSDAPSSPSSAVQQRDLNLQQQRLDSHESSGRTNASNKLEEYFTNGLVNPVANEDNFCDTNKTPAAGERGEPEHQNGAESVEEVLARMLQALQEIGTDKQDQLNDFLERGFLHLEQLLNCSLNPSSSSTISTHLGSQVSANNNANNNNNQPRKSPTNLPHTSTTTLSKDSDYGSDTQSADCFSHLLAGNDLQASVSQINGAQPQISSPGGDSPSPISLGIGSSSANSMSKQQQHHQQQVNNSTGSNLSPLAIELSFKLAESLRQLAQQQQLRQQQQQQQQQNQSQYEDNSELEVKQDPAADKPSSCKQVKKNPMKSIVMINSPSSVVSSPSCCSPELAPSSSTLRQQDGSRSQAGDRNLTPTSESHHKEDKVNIDDNDVDEPSSDLEQNQQSTATSRGNSNKKQQFRTCLDISSSGQVRLVSPPAALVSVPSAEPQLGLDQSAPKVIRQQEFVRRRSGRSSLRRRPSFSGSSTGVRPGSPVPQESQDLKMLAQKATVEKPEEQEQEAESKQKQAKQLQRVLIMAQKYNYSPAKLAASKLGSKLQLKDLTNRDCSQLPTAKKSSIPDLAGPFQTTPINGTSPAKATTLQQDQKRMLSDGDHNHHHQQQKQPIQISGQVRIDISYFARSGMLTVHVMECSQLAPLGKRRHGTSNPYVKLYMLPDKSKSGKRKSSVRKNQLDPKFDEKFTFGPIQLVDFESRTLWLSVWHRDRLGRNEFLGQILLPLSQVRHQLLHSDLCQSTSPKWYQLQPKQQHHHQQQQQQLNGSLANSQRLDERQQALPNGDRALLNLSNVNKNHHETSSAKANRRHLTGSGLERNSGRQLDLAGKLSELQRKAALLTTAVAPSSDQSGSQGFMNVQLGPMVDLNITKADHITGKLFVALKFVPHQSKGPLPVSLNKLTATQLEGQLHVNIKEAHNIAGFENPSVAAMMAACTNHESWSSSSPSSSLDRKLSDSSNVKPLPSGSLPNPFCKCYLLASNGQRVAKHKTVHLKRTSNPRWDFECVFGQVSLASLSSQAIEILMFNRDSILVSNNEFLGGIRLCRSMISANNDSVEMSQLEAELCSERECKLWNQMLSRPNIWVYGELELRLLRPLVPTIVPESRGPRDSNRLEGAICATN